MLYSDSISGVSGGHYETKKVRQKLHLFADIFSHEYYTEAS